MNVIYRSGSSEGRKISSMLTMDFLPVIIAWGVIYKFSTSLPPEGRSTLYLWFGVANVLYITYLFMVRLKPLAKSTNGVLFIYTGLFSKHAIQLDEIKSYRTEPNDDMGIQIVVKYKNGLNATIKIPQNKCTDQEFKSFLDASFSK